MGKSKKKSATTVATPPIAVPKSGRKGKRGAENKIEKSVSAKKQKLERDETVLAKQKAGKEQPKKPAISTSDYHSNDSDSAIDPKPKTPATPEAIVSKTLYVGNLSFSVEESDVRAFFKNAGEMVNVRFNINAKGKFSGFGHVEFATIEAAHKAMELKDQELLGRPVRLGYAPERSNFTPKLRAQTAAVRGFNTSLREDEIRSALQKHFRSCGEITRIFFSPDYESVGVNKMAYIDFVFRSGLEAALQKNKSDIGGGFFLNVQEAKSGADNAVLRLDRGGKSGRGRGGREGGRGGRSSGKGGRGKKKTFWDDD